MSRIVAEFRSHRRRRLSLPTGPTPRGPAWSSRGSDLPKGALGGPVKIGAPHSQGFSAYYGFGGGGQCGLLLPVAPLHCLSPGPGASAQAGTAEIVAMIATAAINLFALDKVLTSFLPVCSTDS